MRNRAVERQLPVTSRRNLTEVVPIRSSITNKMCSMRRQNTRPQCMDIFKWRSIASNQISCYQSTQCCTSTTTTATAATTNAYNHRFGVRRTIGGCHTTSASARSILATFTIFTCIVTAALACPDVILSVCQCEDLHNGIILRCSNTDGIQTMNLLRSHQINLGLIQQLELRNANLKTIPSGFFSGLFIKKLDISHNNIDNVDDNGFLGMNNVLQELLLHHNNLTILPAKALIPLSLLQRIDLSNNSISDIDAENALPPLQKLYEISLADNKICQVHKNAFDDVKHSLQTINLGRNCLREVPAAAIRGFKQLMALHLHNNSITTLDALSFMNLPVMNLLNLASNQISSIHKQTFLNVPNLRYLYLSDNRINDIRSRQFASFEQLEMLDLTGNQIVELQENSFSNLQNLRQLYLGDNRIGNIKEKSFTNSSIQILVLNTNRLTALREGMFDGIVKLQQLTLKDNQIRSIDQNTFYSNPSLAMIDLSDNQLIDVPTSTFFTQLNLFLIDLSGNRLLRTPYGAFNRRVKTVLLQGNPLVCTERVHMLQEGVGIYISSGYDKICEKNLSPTEMITSNLALELPPKSNLTEPAATFVQDIKNEQLRRPSIIRPLSEVRDKGTREKKVDEPSANYEPMIPVHPINAPSNVLPSTGQGFVSPQWAQDANRQSKRMNETNDDQSNQQKMFGNYGLNRNQAHTSDEELRSNSSKSNENDRFSLNNPNIIHPFPVPFLKQPSKLSQSHMVDPAQSTNVPSEINEEATNRVEQEMKPTLPPSIVVVDNLNTNDQSFKPDENNEIEEIQAKWRGQGANEPIIADREPNERLERLAAPSMIILICLSTTVIVMAAVFIGLCIAKHRRMQLLHGSLTSSATAARTNAYVAAQAAQLDMIYGTLQRNRNGQPPERFDDGQAWMYAPVSYGSNYYK